MENQKGRTRILKRNPLVAIRKQCLQCTQWHTKTITFCASVNCPLWPLRFGKQPKDYIAENGKEYEKLFDKEEFQEGGRYDPAIPVEDMKV